MRFVISFLRVLCEQSFLLSLTVVYIRRTNCCKGNLLSHANLPSIELHTQHNEFISHPPPLPPSSPCVVRQNSMRKSDESMGCHDSVYPDPLAPSNLMLRNISLNPPKALQPHTGFPSIPRSNYTYFMWNTCTV